MTQRGSKQVEWTTQEVAYLIENAGRIPKREICKHLKRRSESVSQKAKALRAQGVPVELRCYKPKLEACPACGCMRSTLGRHGICEVCRKRAQLSVIHARISRLLHMLPFEERDKYADTEAEVESVPDPMPASPRLDGLSYYAQCKAKESRDRAMEAWQIRNLNRQVKAAQKRKERIQKKVK